MEKPSNIEKGLTEMTKEELKKVITLKLDALMDFLEEIEKNPDENLREIAETGADQTYEDIKALRETLGEKVRNEILKIKSETPNAERQIPFAKTEERL